MKKLLAWWRLHGRFLSVLVLLTALLWQWRFERVGPNLLPEDACQSLTHWIGGEGINPANASADQNGMVITKRKGEPNFSLFRKLDGIDEVRFLCVTAMASWENAQPHETIHWLQPRVVILGYDAQNRFSAPLDHGIVCARGTRDWHLVQAVVELPPELAQARLSIDGYGEEGVLRLQSMRAEVVKQRGWVVPASFVLSGLWVFALARIMRPYVKGRWPLARAALMGAGMLFGIWQFVFPQSRTLFVPLIGIFSMGPVITAEGAPAPKAAAAEPLPVAAQTPPAPAVPPVSPQQPQPRLRTIAPPDPDAPKKTPDPPKLVELRSIPIPVMPHTVVEPRRGTELGQYLRALDRKWNFESYNLTHFTAFFGIGLFLFGLAGTWRIWPLPCAVAVLGEIIPNLIFDTWDRGDWWDLFANFSGLATACGLVMLVQRIRRKRRQSRCPGSSDSNGAGVFCATDTPSATGDTEERQKAD